MNCVSDHGTPCPCPHCGEGVDLYAGAGVVGAAQRSRLDAGRWKPAAYKCDGCKAPLRLRALFVPVDGRSWEWAGPRPEPVAYVPPTPAPEPAPAPEPEPRRPSPFKATLLDAEGDRLAVGTVWAYDVAEAREQALARHPDFDPERIDVEPDPALAAHVARRTAELDAARAAAPATTGRKKGAKSR